MCRTTSVRCYPYRVARHRSNDLVAVPLRRHNGPRVPVVEEAQRVAGEIGAEPYLRPQSAIFSTLTDAFKPTLQLRSGPGANGCIKLPKPAGSPSPWYSSTAQRVPGLGHSPVRCAFCPLARYTFHRGGASPI